VDGALIDLLEGIGSRKDLDLVERLCAVHALPVMDRPVLGVQFQPVVIVLVELRPSAERAHDRFFHGRPPVLAGASQARRKPR